MSRSVSRPVLVTGATGRTGRIVVDELLRAGVPVRAMSRRPDRAALPSSVDVVYGDLTIPSSLDAALRGIGTVFLVWTVALATAADVIARIASPTSGQARRVVYLSAPHQTAHPFFQQPNPMRERHAEVERLLAASGMPTATLRPGMFASNALHWWAPQIRRGDVVRWPYADVETAPIDERDIAAVAARLLLDDRHARADYVVTGPESMSHAAQVQAIGEAIGRTIRYEELSPEQFVADAKGTWPPGVAEMLLSAWRASVGHRAYVTDVVQEVTGTRARIFARWAADTAAAFGAASG